MLTLLDEMRDFNRTRVTKYKEFYPKNEPVGVLEKTILILRMIHRFPLYKQAHKELPESFRDDLRGIMTEGCIARFQTFKEHTTPFDEGDVESVVQGLTKLAEMVCDEIEQDVKFFQPAFAQELDIVRLTAEIQLKYFILTLEDAGDVLEGEEAVTTASKTVFAFYKLVSKMNKRYAEKVPS